MDTVQRADPHLEWIEEQHFTPTPRFKLSAARDSVTCGGFAAQSGDTLRPTQGLAITHSVSEKVQPVARIAHELQQRTGV
jgi:hypothetical protein